MRSWEQSYSSSPVLVLPPARHLTMDRPSFTSPFTNGTPFAPSHLTPTTSAPSSAAGRKRSRDEAASNLEDDYFDIQPTPEKEPENEDEWVYGEGMTLIKPNKGYIMEAASQTGTWAEEKEAAEKAAQPTTPIAERPILRAAKSQRLDTTATPTISEEVSSNGILISSSPERSTFVEPTVDDFTRHLGIGWSSVSSDPDIQAAVRGWTKFIENHFPVTDAKIRLQSRGLSSYLVEANEGFFLFAEDLKQGQLVSTSLERTWANLSSPVPVFDGTVVMQAIETPSASAEVQMVDEGRASTNGTAPVNGASVGAGEVEMDMS